MSYVRFSDDSFGSDIYAYADAAGGYTLHLAHRRRVGTENLPPNPMLEIPITSTPMDGWLNKYNQWHKALGTLSFEDIQHPDAGETFKFATLEELRDRLKLYRAEGIIRVPDGVIEDIEAEIDGEARV